MKISLNFSPNFDPKKRKKNEIKFIVFHYTGMKSEKKAIEKLLNHNSKVSCHYLIKNNAQMPLLKETGLQIDWPNSLLKN